VVALSSTREGEVRADYPELGKAVIRARRDD
jgi:hypothetical protein